MISIRNFDREPNFIRKMKEEVSYSSINIEQHLSKLYNLLNEDNDVEGLFFLKSKSPIMKKNTAASIINYKGKRNFDAYFTNDSFSFSQFPIWDMISNSNTVNQVEVSMDSPKPFNFEDDKSFLVSPIISEKHNWGMIACFSKGNKQWSKNQLKLMAAFSELLCPILRSGYEKYRTQLQLEALNNKQQEKSKMIEDLRVELNDKAKMIEKLNFEISKNGINDERDEISDLTSYYDEIWLTIQAYKIGEDQPRFSKIHKVQNKEKLNQIQNLFISTPKG